MFRFCLSLCIFIVFIGCQPNNGDPPQPPEPGNTPVEPAPPSSDPGNGEDLTFEVRTEAYDMLGVQESKDWLRKNHYTVTKVDSDTYLIQRNYVSGNVTRKEKTRVQGRGLASTEGTAFTKDDEGNIRVGFARKN